MRTAAHRSLLLLVTEIPLLGSIPLRRSLDLTPTLRHLRLVDRNRAHQSMLQDHSPHATKSLAGAMLSKCQSVSLEIPRFDALQENPTHPDNTRKKYDFLRDYQKAEIGELKSALKLAKTEEDQVTLRRMLVSMENRIKSEDAKNETQNVLRQHRKEEREKVQQGKQPYYLKDKEVKERALVEKFKGMKGKDRQKLLDKRRLKESQKEKKRMPEARRFE